MKHTKVCPICDQPIRGHWCSNCHRFVTPLEYDSNFKLNEANIPTDPFDPREAMSGLNHCKDESTHKQASGTMEHAYLNQAKDTNEMYRSVTVAERNAGTGGRTTPRKNKGVVGALVFVIFFVVLLQLFLPMLLNLVRESGNTRKGEDVSEDVSVEEAAEEGVVVSSVPLEDGKAALEQWMDQEGIEYQMDESNDKETYTGITNYHLENEDDIYLTWETESRNLIDFSVYASTAQEAAGLSYAFLEAALGLTKEELETQLQLDSMEPGDYYSDDLEDMSIFFSCEEGNTLVYFNWNAQ